MTIENSSGTNPVITAYDRGRVFLRNCKFVDRDVTTEAGNTYAVGDVMGVITSTGKAATLLTSDTAGKELPKFVLAQPVTNSAVAATSGSFLSTDISANLAGMLALTDAEFDIAVDGGSAVSVTAWDISATGAVTMADLAAALQLIIVDPLVTVVGTATTIQIFSATTGTSSAIALTVTGGSGTDLTGASYLNLAAATEAAGVAATTNDVENVRMLAEGEVDSTLLGLPSGVTIDTIVTSQGSIKNLLKSEGIITVTGQENTFLDNGASLT